MGKCIADESESAHIIRKQSGEFLAVSFVADEPGLDSTGAKDAKIMDGMDCLAAELGACAIGNQGDPEIAVRLRRDRARREPGYVKISN
jgi:hypothetical protein